MQPCHVSYHAECLRVGPPFTSRLKRGQGLSFPKVRHWGTFICELCTVRGVLARELRCAADIDLLRFKRMRLIDMANAWASGTHTQYQQKLSIIRQFEHDYRFSVLSPLPLDRPPASIDIPLMWIQESYSLRPSPKRDGTISMATVRHLRSAASQFLGWEMMINFPTSTFLDQQQRVLQQPCRPTDGYSYSLMTKGMSGRLGTESTPATALLFRHVHYMDSVFDTNFRNATTFDAKRRWALAGLANLAFWLGWLRSMEVFSLTFDDVTVVFPDQGPLHDLPPGLGMVLFRLLPQTKTNRTSTADVVVAFKTMSGLSPGHWSERLSFLLFGTRHWPASQAPIFCESDGTLWSSHFFRVNFVYPCLTQLQAGGDPYLRPFHGDGNTITDKFWSMHMYRRGARSHVSRGGSHDNFKFKIAKPMQVYEHGRWRRRRMSEAIDLQYNEWTYADRLHITLFCQ